MKIKRTRNYRKTNNRASYWRARRKITEKKVVPRTYIKYYLDFFFKNLELESIILSVILCENPPRKYYFFNP